eukprot:4439288-Amphidinium_carterae.1
MAVFVPRLAYTESQSCKIKARSACTDSIICFHRDCICARLSLPNTVVKTSKRAGGESLMLLRLQVLKS